MKTILLLGDSITEAFPRNDLMRDQKIINKGVFGDNTRSVLDRLDRDVLHQRCDLLFVLIGTNDMASGFSNGEIIANIGEIVNQIVTHRVARTMYVQSILPTRGLSDRPIERIEFLNRQIRRIARLSGAVYLDIGSLFVNSNGEIRNEYSADGLHLTGKGYDVWGKCLDDVISGTFPKK